MSRAYGANARLLLKREQVYGTKPDAPFYQMPFTSCSLSSEQGLLDDPVLGYGRDPKAPLRDVIHDTGDIGIPLDPRYLGFWLTGLLGNPESSENQDKSFAHVFHSGSSLLPSYSLEVGFKEVPAYFMHGGVMINSLNLEFARSGAATATLNVIAQGETRSTASSGGEALKLPFTRISQFQGSISKEGTPLGNLTGGSLTYSNNLESIETIRSDGRIDGIDPTIASLTGSLDVRFADTALIDAATKGDPIMLEFAYTLSKNCFLTFKARALHLPKPKLAIEGPGGIQAKFDFQGALGDGQEPMLTVALNNDQPGGTYQ
jgi:hypothetical protein